MSNLSAGQERFVEKKKIFLSCRVDLIFNFTLAKRERVVTITGRVAKDGVQRAWPGARLFRFTCKNIYARPRTASVAGSKE